MNELETKRLQIIALTANQLDMLINNIIELEKNINCKYDAEPIEGEFKQILQMQLEATKQDESNYMWHSFWIIIRKADRKAIGLIDFKDIPNKENQVEIGYGLGKQYEKQGYMTETVEKLCDWALKKDNVKHIIAETELDGYASQNVLKRCGFKQLSKD